jgi:ribA/ribD-fused uncharacterized protein
MSEDWDERKEDVMEKAVYAKFSQHDDMKRLLLETQNFSLVQLKPNDPFWGTGSAGEGKNMLGCILMRIRGRLRHEEKMRK